MSKKTKLTSLFKKDKEVAVTPITAEPVKKVAPEPVKEVAPEPVKEVAVAPVAKAEKPKLSPAQIKELLKDYSKVTLKARGII